MSQWLAWMTADVAGNLEINLNNGASNAEKGVFSVHCFCARSMTIIMPSGSSGDVKLKRSIVFKKRNPGDQPDAQEQRVIGRFRVKNMGSTRETYIYIYIYYIYIIYIYIFIYV